MSHRKAMIRNMLTDLIKHERIETTLPRAKSLRVMADRAVGWGKGGTLHHRRQALGYVRTPAMVNKLFSELAPRYADRDGGYCRVLRTRRRRGDGAQMAYIEYVDRPGELRPARPAKASSAKPSASASASAEESAKKE